MLQMSKTTLGLGVVLLAAVGAAFYAQQRTNAALRREMAGLREEVRRAIISGSAPKMAVATAPADEAVVRPLQLEEKDLAAMALAPATPPATTKPAASAGRSAPEPATGNPAALQGVISAGELKNFGRATPEAGAATALWAAVRGELDTLARALLFTPATKEKADDWFAGLPDRMRRDYGSPEAIMASLIAREAAALESLQVLGRRETSPDLVEVQVRFENAEGKGKEETFVMRQAAGGWGLELPDELVKKLAKRFMEEK